MLCVRLACLNDRCGSAADISDAAARCLLRSSNQTKNARNRNLATPTSAFGRTADAELALARRLEDSRRQLITTHDKIDPGPIREVYDKVIAAR